MESNRGVRARMIVILQTDGRVAWKSVDSLVEKLDANRMPRLTHANKNKAYLSALWYIFNKGENRFLDGLTYLNVRIIRLRWV